jgi:hypothetical protein
VLQSIALIHQLAVPLKAECLECADDAGRGARNLARPIEILDSQ